MINQWCAELAGYQLKGGWTDSNDNVPDVRGRNHCSYAVPTVDITCPVNNPVIPGTGLKVWAEQDHPGFENGLLALTRHYRSGWPEGLTGGLTPKGGWKLPWNAQVTRPMYERVLRWSSQKVEPVVFVLRPTGNLELYRAAVLSSGQRIWSATNGAHTLTEMNPAVNGESWLLQDSATDQKEYYSATGHLTRVVARDGSHISVSRDADERLQSVTSSKGRQWTFTYNGNAIKTAEGTGGVVVTFSYNNGNLVQVARTSAMGKRQYHYEDTLNPHALTGITDGSGVRTATYAYTNGRIATTTGVDGSDYRTYSYSQGAGGDSRCDINGPEGYTSLGFTDTNFQRQQTTGLLPGTSVLTQLNSSRGQPLRQATADNRVVYTTYNSKGQEIERAMFGASYLGATARPPLNAASSVVSTQWHAQWAQPLQIAQPSSASSYTYDSRGNLTVLLEWATSDSTGAQGFAAARTGPIRATETVFDVANRPIALVKRTDGVATQHWAYTYDGTGQLVGVQDMLAGQSATVVVNAQGKPTRIATSTGAVAEFAWSSLGQLQSAQLPGYGASFQYDARQWLSVVRFDNGKTLRITYNALGEPVSVKDIHGNVLPVAVVLPDHPGMPSLASVQNWWDGIYANLQASRQRSTLQGLGLAHAQVPLSPLPPNLVQALAAGLPGGAGAAWVAQQACEVCSPYTRFDASASQLQLQARLPFMLLTAQTVVQAADLLVADILTLKESAKLRRNMLCKTDAHYQPLPDDGKCRHAHHIVPYADSRFRAAIEARAILVQAGIDINSAANGVWMECDRHLRMHNDRVRAEAYYREVRNRLEESARAPVEITKALNKIRMEILSNTFPGTY